KPNMKAPVFHAKMYAMADKYNIPGLKIVTKRYFKDSIVDSFANQDFYDAIDIIFTSTREDDLGLRNVVL
ncbi:hypothetical protein P280DRAFT_385650, partial [Massarina eburnea CBS 473.64]